MVQLSNELQDMIIDFLYDDQDTLRTCSLVCKSWLPSARFHRFREKTSWPMYMFPISSLSWAAKFELEDLARTLLGWGDVDVASWDREWAHPLCYVAMNGNEVIAKLLLARPGVSINKEQSAYHSDYSLTPLSWAAKNGHAGIAKLLLAYGNVNVNVADRRNHWTPLMWAARNGSVEVVKLLLERSDIDVNAVDEDGLTALNSAVGLGNEVIVKLLLKRDDIDVSHIPLHDALHRTHLGTLKLLLERDDLDVNHDRVGDRHFDSALIHAVRNSWEESMRMLLERDDIDVNYKDRDFGQTPLLKAAWFGEEGMVRMLLEKDGVDIDAVDKDGETAISRAIEQGHEKVAKLLLEHKRAKVLNGLP
jgi:ankyrin repeat protein